MTRFVPLNPNDHAVKKWVRSDNYSFAARDAVVPLVASELSAAASEFPIGFVRDGAALTLAALLSFKPNENLFVGPDGKWLGTHVPMALRSNPFRLLHRSNQPGMVLCVDEDSDCIGTDAKGEALFDASGSPTQAVKEVLQFLERFEFLRKITDSAVAALSDAAVIVPWSISVVGRNQPQASVDGAYRIDEAVLNKLDDEAFLRLRKAKALPIAFVQLFSMQQTRRLGQMAQVQDRLKVQATEHQRMLNEMFKLDDGTIPL
jgi:hypothetical protein